MQRTERTKKTMLPTFWKNRKLFCPELFSLLQQMKILSGGGGAKTGCSHSGFRLPKHGEKNSDTSNTRERNSNTAVKSSKWKIGKKIMQVKNWSPCEDWSRSCPFCGVDGSGLKNVQLVDCHSSSGSASTHPQSTQIFNEDQIVLSWTQFLLPTSEKLWNLLSLKRFREKLTSFCEMPKQLLLDFEETDFVQLNAPSPQPSCPRPVQGRMNENRTFSGSRARQQVVYEGEKLQSVWPGTSEDICDYKCWQALKWVRWHVWTCV